MNKETQRKRRRAKAIAEHRAGRRGPERSVTLDVVERVGTLMAVGLTLELALALEEAEIRVETWQRALQRDAKLFTHYRYFQAVFMERVCLRLAASDDLADLKWLLTRCHPELFALPLERAQSHNPPAEKSTHAV
jgi:hypothetical protein